MRLGHLLDLGGLLREERGAPPVPTRPGSDVSTNVAAAIPAFTSTSAVSTVAPAGSAVSGDIPEHWPRRASGSAIILRMVGLRWEGDERGEGVADATGFVAGVFELVDAMRSPSWVAEEPGVHLLPHIERACRTLLLEVEDARLSADGSFDVHLSWTGQGWRVGEIRAAVFALVGSFAEIATYVRQRRVTTENRDETLLFEIVTGILDDGDNVFAPHGHTVQISVSPAP